MCQIIYMAEKLTNHSVKTVRNWPKIFQNSILYVTIYIYIYVAAYVNSVFMTRLFLCQDVCDMGGIAGSFQDCSTFNSPTSELYTEAKVGSFTNRNGGLTVQRTEMVVLALFDQCCWCQQKWWFNQRYNSVINYITDQNGYYNRYSKQSLGSGYFMVVVT